MTNEYENRMFFESLYEDGKTPSQHFGLTFRDLSELEMKITTDTLYGISSCGQNTFMPFLRAARLMKKYNVEWQHDKCPIPIINEECFKSLISTHHPLAHKFIEAYDNVKGCSFSKPNIRKLLQELIVFEGI